MEKSKTTTIRKLTWSEIGSFVDRFVERVSTDDFDCIVTVARGGLIPAVMISHRLGIRELIVIRIVRNLNDDIHASKDAPSIEFHQDDLEKTRGKGVLLVDDIVGSGTTLEYTLDLLKKFDPKSITTFSLALSLTNYAAGKPRPDYVGQEVREWIVFPWENQNV